TPAPASEPLPPPPPEAPKAPPAPTLVRPPEKVRPVIAKVEQGPAGLAGTPVASGQPLEATDTVVLRFTDGSRLDLAPQTLLREIVDEPAIGKRVTIANGAVTGDIVKQPLGKPLVFTTPHASAKVLGTVLRLSVDPKSTRLEVREGKVQLRRSSDNKAV